jgi:WD40 repeat protein
VRQIGSKREETDLAGEKMGCTAAKVPSASPHPQTRTEGQEDLQTPHLKQKIILFSPITCMDISEDLSMLALGTADGVLHVFSTMSAPVEDLAQLKGHSVSLSCCCRKSTGRICLITAFRLIDSGEHHLLSLVRTFHLFGLSGFAHHHVVRPHDASLTCLSGTSFESKQHPVRRGISVLILI